MDLFETLRALSALPGPSGTEEPVSRAVREMMAPLVDRVYTDRLGNAVGEKNCGRPGAPRLLLDAHLDEIGFVVTGVEEGFLRIQTIGGVDARVLPGREMTILTNPPLFGVVAALPPHLQTAEEMEKTIPLDQLRIDIGMDQQAAVSAVTVGTRAVYRAECFRLGKDQVCGKALDDRACITALLRTLELLRDRELDVDLTVLCSTFEETGGAGAATGAFGARPDLCVAVDVTHGRTPDGPKSGTFPLGGGPAIGVGPNMARWMSQRMEEKAKAAKLPYGLEVLPGDTGTNAWVLQISREGVATGLLSLPLKYMHTPVEVVQLSDLEALAQLLADFITGLGKEAPLCWSC